MSRRLQVEMRQDLGSQPKLLVAPMNNDDRLCGNGMESVSLCQIPGDGNRGEVCNAPIGEWLSVAPDLRGWPKSLEGQLDRNQSRAEVCSGARGSLSPYEFPSFVRGGQQGR
jgi:hypothetical protein